MSTRIANREFAVRKASGNGGGPQAEKPGQDAQPASIRESELCLARTSHKIHGLHRKVQAMIILGRALSKSAFRPGNNVEGSREFQVSSFRFQKQLSALSSLLSCIR